MGTKILRLDHAGKYRGCVLTYGHFSTVHIGHVRYLKHAHGYGRRLVVALMGDGGRQVWPYEQEARAEALVLLGIADAIVLLEGDEIEQAIRVIQPKTLVLGNEFRNRAEMERTISLQIRQGGNVKYHAGDIQYATTDLLSRSESELQRERFAIFNSACRRQGIDSSAILKTTEMWKNTRLIVLGDTIVDQFAACEAIGMSAEAPVVVVRELEKKNFVGGAGVVAAHITALGARCDLVSVVGRDSIADFVREDMKRQGVGDGLVVDRSRPTTFKKRYIVENQKLFRVSRLEDHNLHEEVEDLLIERLEDLAPGAKGIVVSDFVYGVVTNRVLERVQTIADRYNLMLFGDLQCSSQVGSVARFKKFSLLCPNERETRLALQDKDNGLEHLSRELIRLTESRQIVMKLGSEGFIAYERLADGSFNSQAFPALSVNPVDVSGAGDSLLAVFSTGLASNQPMMETAALACCMAALAVESMGNTPIKIDRVKGRLKEIMG